ncbi:ABC transporter ATP-binding protein [Actinomadura sp. NTSP31]|uniref:ABC transporter ATP-binding protein n=1 Tax=Actinomadura sp. NTSP31 TaxID=1735447 RepID=UPI0035C23F71
MLDAETVSKSFGPVRVLDGMDLRVAAGQVVALLGRNGAGKSTFISIVAGLLRPDGGRVRVCGTDMARHARRARANLGIAPQDLGLYLTLTPEENLDLMARLARVPGRDRPARVRDVAERLALTDFLRRPCRTLSGGQQRRVHTAMALMGGRALILLDEPTVGADVQSRNAITDTVRELAAAGSAILYTTHYLHEVEALHADVVIMNRGRVTAAGTCADLLNAHGDTGLEIRFDGPPPSLPLHPQESATLVAPNTVRVATRDPSGTMERLLPDLTARSGSLAQVQIVRPTLEAVFLSLTEPGGPGTAAVEPPASREARV